MINHDTIMRLIALNVEMEGALRVLASRPSDEALTQARAALSQINALIEAPAAAEIAAEPEPAQVTPAAEAPEAVETTDNSDATQAAEDSPVRPVAPSSAPEQPLASVPVDEMLARRESRDLRKAFTLNDKFLFRRELFADSDTEFNDTIDLLVAMDSLDEAREYLLHDLQWDAENPVVADFIAIVTNHFSSRGR